MKTTGFCKLEVTAVGDGLVSFEASSPTDGSFVIDMTADECFIFLVEMGNAMSDARKLERGKRQSDELVREKRR